ncbi:unnamed protein product [Allacma fusca]|uniref:G domain-containing protein n=1 Tax=Allacma fusca TaxID=39272 RepID=A0A8J2Q2L4_9HEXA|nr:unnamed protein product [Allacma fusca]
MCFIWYTILALVHVSLAFNHNRLSAPKVSPLAAPEDQIADETIDLIKRGQQEIPFSKNYKNVVLVVGNTGAGKTTLTKFITGQPLIAYRKAGRNLIKDADDKISHGSTLVSKTIFPDMFVDEDTNTAYFDLPGFSDTRNASIELANSWFMKLVADHVEKVKIVFIVTFSTLRSGESRTDFKGLLEHATSFILQPSKFLPAIALVASKVDSYTPDDTIVPDIAEFLETEKEGLRSIFGQDRDKLQKVLALIDAFLVKNPSGDYERIGFFKQPTNVGDLNTDPAMKVRRESLKDIIDNRLQYVRKEQEDFGISVSDNARYYVRVIVEKLNSKFTDLMNQLANAIRQHYQQQQSSNTPIQVFLGKFLQEVAQLENMAQNLTRSYSRLSFIRILAQQLPPLPSYSPTLKELAILDKNLEFYEKIDKRSIAAESLEWAQPLRSTVIELKLQASKFLMALNTQVETYATEMVKSLETLYEKTVQDGNKADHSQQESIKQSLAKDLQIIEVLKRDLPQQLSFNSFWNVAKSTLETLSVSNMKSPSSQPPVLADDIPLQPHPQLKSDAWIRTLYHLFSSISTKHSEFIRIIQEKKHEAGIQTLNSNITNLLEHNSKVTEIAEKSERRLNESILQQKKQATETATRIREMAAKEVKLRQEMKKEREDLERKAEAQVARLRAEAIARDEANRRRYEEEQRKRDEEVRNREEKLRQEIKEQKEAREREQKEREDRARNKEKKECAVPGVVRVLFFFTNFACL